MAHFNVARVSGRSDNIHIFADNLLDILLCSELEIIGFLHEAKQWTSIYVNCLSQSTTPGHSEPLFVWYLLLQNSGGILEK